MAKNYRGTGERATVTAAAARVSGQLVYEQQLAGIAETDAAITTRYALRIAGEVDVPLATGAAKGDDVFISTTTQAVTRAARGTAAVAGTVLCGRVTGIPGDAASGLAAEPAPKAGRMLMRLIN
jgi:predicted RecA/RadA family phage recombinase